MEAEEEDAEALADLIEEMQGAAAQTAAVALARDKDRIRRLLQERADNLALRLQIMRLKYAHFRRIHDRVNMTIIIVSSCAALVETVKGELRLNDKNVTPAGTYHFLQLLPAGTSAVTGFLAALIKFRKYAERLEALGRAIERTVACAARQARLSDAVAATQTLEELDALRPSLAEVAEEVSGTLTAMAAVLKFSDIVRHTPAYHALTLSYLQAERRFQKRAQGLMDDRGTLQLPEGPILRRRPIAAALRSGSSWWRRCCCRRRSGS